jgi:hypothetical protein
MSKEGYILPENRKTIPCDDLRDAFWYKVTMALRNSFRSSITTIKFHILTTPCQTKGWGFIRRWPSTKKKPVILIPKLFYTPQLIW